MLSTSAKYSRRSSNKKLKRSIDDANRNIELSRVETEKAELLLPFSTGYIETEGLERSYKIKQASLSSLLDKQSASKIFDLKLNGRYSFRYSSDGRNLLLASSTGHVSLMNWSQFQLKTELFLNEEINDCSFLANNFFALAQDHVYIYDNNGIEIHSGSNGGVIRWFDVSIGNEVATHPTGFGPIRCLSTNPSNGISLLGHSNGTVTMWSPTTSSSLITMLTHSAPVLSIGCSINGNYMVTSGLDGLFRVWDIRTLKKLHSYFSLRPSSSISISQRGMVAIECGSSVQLWNNIFLEKSTSPYLVHDLPGSNIRKIDFCPFEDVLGIGHSNGFSSIIVPGSAEANYDYYEVNPNSSKRSRREGEVRRLLDKLPYDSITMDESLIGTVSKTALDSENEEEKGKNKKTKKKKRKRGKGGRGNIIDQRTIKREIKQIKEKKALEAERPPSPLDRFR